MSNENGKNNGGLRLYVGNLPYTITKARLLEEFGRYGAVIDCHLPLDRLTRQPRGFGFVTFQRSQDGYQAIDAMNGAEIEGRELRVNEARPRE